MPDLSYVLEAQGELLARLGRVPDPRSRRGIRHRQANVLLLAICATLAGRRNFVAIGEWVGQLPQEALERLGCRRDPVQGHRVPPISEPTLRRTLEAVDVDLVDRELGAFLRCRANRAAVAVDGKAVRCGGVRADRRLWRSRRSRSTRTTEGTSSSVSVWRRARAA